MTYYYSTQPYLARCLNRYFYDDIHFVYCSTEFYPYRLKNPKSSSPYDIYSDLYRPWKDKDVYDKFISQARLNLGKGVVEMRLQGVVTRQEARRLKTICEKVDLLFFYPIVYRIVASKVTGRVVRAASGARGSSEYKIVDLSESAGEFDILFLDFRRDADFETLLGRPVGDKVTAFPVLEGRC